MREGSAVAGPALTAPGALGVTAPPAQLTHFSPKQQLGRGGSGLLRDTFLHFRLVSVPGARGCTQAWGPPAEDGD